MAVTTPLEFTVAMALSLLDQVPTGFEAESNVDSPIHNELSPVILMPSSPSTLIAAVGSERQSVEELVKIKVAFPSFTPVTIPLFSTVAILSSLLIHVPPVEGDRLVVVPTHIAAEPVILTVGLGFTVIGVDATEVQVDVLS